MPFQKISVDLKFSWNIQDLEAQFEPDIISKPTYSRPDGKPHWQLFPLSGIRFARNLHLNFEKEMSEVIDGLQQMQNMLRGSGLPESGLNIFLKHKQFKLQNCSIIKVMAGTSVSVHIDRERQFALNIGLKNSSSCTTYFHNSVDEPPETGFQMYDGSVYIFNTKKLHSVVSNMPADSGIDRYVITYTLVWG